MLVKYFNEDKQTCELTADLVRYRAGPSELYFGQTLKGDLHDAGQWAILKIVGD